MSFEPDNKVNEAQEISLLKSILTELKKMNIILAEISGLEIDNGDVDG